MPLIGAENILPRIIVIQTLGLSFHSPTGYRLFEGKNYATVAFVARLPKSINLNLTGSTKIAQKEQ